MLSSMNISVKEDKQPLYDSFTMGLNHCFGRDAILSHLQYLFPIMDSSKIVEKYDEYLLKMYLKFETMGFTKYGNIENCDFVFNKIEINDELYHTNTKIIKMEIMQDFLKFCIDLSTNEINAFTQIYAKIFDTFHNITYFEVSREITEISDRYKDHFKTDKKYLVTYHLINPDDGIIKFICNRYLISKEDARKKYMKLVDPIVKLLNIDYEKQEKCPEYGERILFTDEDGEFDKIQYFVASYKEILDVDKILICALDKFFANEEFNQYICNHINENLKVNIGNIKIAPKIEIRVEDEMYIFIYHLQGLKLSAGKLIQYFPNINYEIVSETINKIFLKYPAFIIPNNYQNGIMFKISAENYNIRELSKTMVKLTHELLSELYWQNELLSK